MGIAEAIKEKADIVDKALQVLLIDISSINAAPPGKTGRRSHFKHG
jgi:hypothetical protein